MISIKPRGRPLRYSDTAITTVLMLKNVFHLALRLRALQGFIDSVFQLMDVPLRCPDYTSISKRAKQVNVNIKTPTRGEIAHRVIDSTGLKVFGEGDAPLPDFVPGNPLAASKLPRAVAVSLA